MPDATPVVHARFKGIKPAPIGITYNLPKWYAHAAENAKAYGGDEQSENDCLFNKSASLEMIPTLLGITLISFFIIHLAPGKPTDILTELNPKITPEARERLEKLYNLDKPVIIQYGLWLKRIVNLILENRSQPTEGLLCRRYGIRNSSC